MRRSLYLALALLIFCPLALSQTSTTVNGTVVDNPDNQAWFAGNFYFTFRVSPSNPTGPYFWSGAPFSIQQTISGSLDGSGHYSVSVPSNSSITPSGSAWDLTVCPQATSPCFTVQSVIVTGATLTVSPTPPSIRINMGSPPPTTRAYADGELVAGLLGQQYFNLSSAVIRVCSTFPCGWTTITGTGGSAASPVNSLQKNNPSAPGSFTNSNLSESGSVLTNGDDNILRGPNPGGVDVRKFGVRAINPNAAPNTTVTATINSGSNSAVVSSVAGLQVGDGYAITKAGSAQTMTAPSGITIIPSCAAGPLGMGYTVSSGVGSTTYQYQAAMRDQGQGLTAASSVQTTTGGNAVLGAKSTAVTNILSGASNVFTANVASTADLAAGCLIAIKGTSDDAHAGGWFKITSIVNLTQFLYQSNVDASVSTFTSPITGGTVYYWLCNHLVLPTPGAGGIQYLIYGRTSGSNVLIGESLPANLGFTDPTYNTWDDYGSPMMDGLTLPWWAPTAPPSSPTTDTFTSTITGIVGNTLSFVDNASTSVVSAPARFDNAPNELAAIAAINNTTTTGAGGTIRFPVVVENSVTGNYCYVSNSYLNMNNVRAVYQDGSVCLGDTLQFNGKWIGTYFSAARLIFPPFGFEPHIGIYGLGANPVVYTSGVAGMSHVYLHVPGNGGIGLFNTASNGGQLFYEDSFVSGDPGDYMSIPFYDYNSSVWGGFGGKIRDSSFIVSSAPSGTQAQVGQTAAPTFATKYNTEWNLDQISCGVRGFLFVPFQSGLSGEFRQGEECQGNIMPMITIMGGTPGTTSGSFTIENTTIDTGPAPLATRLDISTQAYGGSLTIINTNLPSANQPLISGYPFKGITLIGSGISNAGQLAQVGQNTNICIMGNSNDFMPGVTCNQFNFTQTVFANLGTPSNGTQKFCSDCVIANPCAGSGTGAMAKRLAGVWVCN
jgi:hypothetical protein